MCSKYCINLLIDRDIYIGRDAVLSYSFAKGIHHFIGIATTGYYVQSILAWRYTEKRSKMATNHIYEEGFELPGEDLSHRGARQRLSRVSSQDSGKFPEDEGMIYSPENHMSDILLVLSTMRENGELCDVVVVAEDTRIPAHRVVLASCIPYFKLMFTGEMKEKYQEEILLHDVQADALRAIVSFCYSSKLHITKDNVQDLLTLATMLQMEGVQYACSKFLGSQLHPSNVLGIRSFADAHSCATLLHRCNLFLQQRFPEIVLHEEFLQLSYDAVLEIVSNDNLNVRGEEQVYEAVLAWVRHNEEERKPVIADLLKHVRMALMTAVFLSREVKEERLVMENFDGRGLLIDAMNYHLRRNYLRDGTIQNTCGLNITPRRCPGLEHLFAVGGSGPPIMEQVPYLDLCECYDVEKDEWRMVAPLPKPRSGLRVASVNSYLYAIGGFSDQDTKALSGVDRYDPMSDSWRPVAPMIMPRRGFAVAVLNNYIYAIGGINSGTYYNTVERYCPRSNQWSMVASMNSERRALGAASLDRYIYAAGGLYMHVYRHMQPHTHTHAHTRK